MYVSSDSLMSWREKGERERKGGKERQGRKDKTRAPEAGEQSNKTGCHTESVCAKLCTFHMGDTQPKQAAENITSGSIKQNDEGIWKATVHCSVLSSSQTTVTAPRSSVTPVPCPFSPGALCALVGKTSKCLGRFLRLAQRLCGRDSVFNLFTLSMSKKHLPFRFVERCQTCVFVFFVFPFQYAFSSLLLLLSRAAAVVWVELPSKSRWEIQLLQNTVLKLSTVARSVEVDHSSAALASPADNSFLAASQNDGHYFFKRCFSLLFC